MADRSDDVIAEARSWIGTPYHHQASVKGAGADCLGLVRGIWREVYGGEPERTPPYTADWAEVGRRETLLQAAGRHLWPVPPDTRRPGDLLVFRWRADCPAKHCAILTAPDRMIHALENAAVVEVTLGPWWVRRIAAAFRFPKAEI